MYELTIHNQDDLTNVHASCSCGEWEFRGDWDEMANSWFAHEMDPEFKYIYVTKDDHVGRSVLTRAGGAKLKEIMERRNAK